MIKLRTAQAAVIPKIVVQPFRFCLLNTRAIKKIKLLTILYNTYLHKYIINRTQELKETETWLSWYPTEKNCLWFIVVNLRMFCAMLCFASRIYMKYIDDYCVYFPNFFQILLRIIPMFPLASISSSWKFSIWRRTKNVRYFVRIK